MGACAVGCAAALTLRHCTGAEGRWHAPCDSARPWPSGRPAPECSPGRRHRRSWLTASVGARRGDKRARSGGRRMAAVPGQRHRGEGAGRWRAIPAGGRGAALGAKQAEGQAAEGLRPRGTVARARGRAWRCGRRQPRRGGQRAPTSALLIGGTGAVGNKQGTYPFPSALRASPAEATSHLSCAAPCVWHARRSPRRRLGGRARVRRAARRRCIGMHGRPGRHPRPARRRGCAASCARTP